MPINVSKENAGCGSGHRFDLSPACFTLTQKKSYTLQLPLRRPALRSWERTFLPYLSSFASSTPSAVLPRTLPRDDVIGSVFSYDNNGEGQPFTSGVPFFTNTQLCTKRCYTISGWFGYLK